MDADQYTYHRFTLKFLNSGTEAKYLKLILDRTLIFSRIAWVMALLLGGSFALLDRQMFGENAGLVLLVRIIFLFMAAVFLFLNYVKPLKKNMDWNSSALLLLISLFSIFLTAIDDHQTFSPYFTGMLIGFISIFATAGLGFRLIFPSLLVIFTVFNTTFVLIPHISLQLLIVYNFLLLTMILVIAYAAYLIEHVSRKNFIVTGELLDSLTQVRKLSGMLPICANCKKIRDDQGYWNQIESYIREHSEVDFSHCICPDCAAELYPDLYPPKNK